MAAIAVNTGPFRTNRVQTTIVARSEKDLIAWICVRLPAWTTPDLLTLIGIFGAVLTMAGYAFSRFEPRFLWVASFGLVVHWFGDSLDGSLARFRHIERPIYGYFLDHTVDALCNLMIMFGLGLTLQVRMDVALFTLIGYYLLCIYVFINNHLSGVFILSFMKFGPTELRIMIIVLNTWMFFAGPVRTMVPGAHVTIFDLLLTFVGAAFTAIFVFLVIKGVRTLRHPDRSGARPKFAADGPVDGTAVDQSAATNASNAAK